MHVDIVRILNRTFEVFAVNLKVIFLAIGPARYKSRMIATIKPIKKSVIQPKKEICPNVSLR